MQKNYISKLQDKKKLSKNKCAMEREGSWFTLTKVRTLTARYLALFLKL